MNYEQSPLFVDLDGTLVATDCLLELLLVRLRRRPWDLCLLPFWLLQGRARLKAQLSAEEKLDVSLLPYRRDLCDFLRDQRARRRPLYLATASDQVIARQVAAHLRLFDGVLASDGHNNLKGLNKLAAIRRSAPDGFSYAGDSRADSVIWAAADAAIPVGAPPSVVDGLARAGKLERSFPRSGHSLREVFRALRPHQWAKNLLVFVPLLTSFHLFAATAALEALIAFAAFCLCASGTYVVNDLFDLAADRAHPKKRRRPFASGRLSLPAGAALAAGAVAAGLALAASQSLLLLAVTASYIVLTLSYSFYLKTRVLMDVILLAALYTLRIFAGAIAIAVPVSVWLLVFALFVFTSLALVKRCAELVALRAAGREKVRGRNYNTEDLQVFWPLGVATAVCSVLVFALYVTSGAMTNHYGTPHLLWLVAMGLFYWLGRMWIKTSRGEMDDDPLVYTAKDRGTRIVIIAMVATTLAAFFWHS